MSLKGKHLRKGRCLVIMTLLFMLISFLGGGFDAQADNVPRSLQPIAVKSGDTLWDLVEEYYDYGGDIRQAIYEVRHINGMESVELDIGQVIYIPTNCR